MEIRELTLDEVNLVNGGDRESIKGGFVGWAIGEFMNSVVDYFGSDSFGQAGIGIGMGAGFGDGYEDYM